MNFLQITLGDIIGYILIATGFAFTIGIHVNYASHHNKKNTKKVNQSKSHVKGDQIGGNKNV